MQYNDAVYQYGGNFISNGEWIHPDRIINTDEIIFVTRGSFVMREEETDFKLCENDTLILERGKRHRGIEKTTEKIEFFWFHYTSQDKVLKSDKHVNIRESDRFLLLAKLLLHSFGTKDYPRDSLDCILKVILTEIHMNALYLTALASPTLSLACELIRIGISEGIDVKQISEKVSLNPDYLSRMFKKAYNLTLKEYIDREKIKYIKNLLLTSDMPLKEISDKCGFSDTKAFLKFVKYHEGLSPGKIRNAIFKTHINNV